MRHREGLYVPSQFVRLLRFAVAFNSTWNLDASAEECSSQTALGIAVNPAGQSGFDPLWDFRFTIRRSRELIYVPELVIGRVHGIHAVNESLHLAVHLIIGVAQQTTPALSAFCIMPFTSSSMTHLPSSWQAMPHYRTLCPCRQGKSFQSRNLQRWHPQ